MWLCFVHCSVGACVCERLKVHFVFASLQCFLAIRTIITACTLILRQKLLCSQVQRTLTSHCLLRLSPSWQLQNHSARRFVLCPAVFVPFWCCFPVTKFLVFVLYMYFGRSACNWFLYATFCSYFFEYRCSTKQSINITLH